MSAFRRAVNPENFPNEITDAEHGASTQSPHVLHIRARRARTLDRFELLEWLPATPAEPYRLARCRAELTLLFGVE